MACADFSYRILYGSPIAHIDAQVFHLRTTRAQLLEASLLRFAQRAATGKQQRYPVCLIRHFLRKQQPNAARSACNQILPAGPPRRLECIAFHLLQRQHATLLCLVANLTVFTPERVRVEPLHEHLGTLRSVHLDRLSTQLRVFQLHRLQQTAKTAEHTVLIALCCIDHELHQHRLLRTAVQHAAHAVQKLHRVFGIAPVQPVLRGLQYQAAHPGKVPRRPLLICMPVLCRATGQYNPALCMDCFVCRCRSACADLPMRLQQHRVPRVLSPLC